MQVCLTTARGLLGSVYVRPMSNQMVKQKQCIYCTIFALLLFSAQQVLLCQPANSNCNIPEEEGATVRQLTQSRTTSNIAVRFGIHVHQCSSQAPVCVRSRLGGVCFTATIVKTIEYRIPQVQTPKCAGRHRLWDHTAAT